MVTFVMITSDLKYKLIDYGLTFSIDGSIPPMEYMVNDDEIPVMEDDMNNLRRIRDSY